MIDLHTHLWPHQPGTELPTYDDLARLCEIAAARGVEQIAITEHCNRFEEIADIALPLWRRDGELEVRAEADRVWAQERGAHLDAYVDLLLTAQARGLPLLVGLEVDHLPGANEAIGEVLGQYPFDILLGSVHWLGSWLFDAYDNAVFGAAWQRRSTEDVWDDYTNAVADLAMTGTVDVIAHLPVARPPPAASHRWGGSHHGVRRPHRGSPRLRVPSRSRSVVRPRSPECRDILHS